MASAGVSKTNWVRKIFQRMLDGGFDGLLMKDMAITNATDGKVSAEILIQAHHMNRLKTAHGGMIASLVDVCGSLAVASKGMHLTGVSTDINVSYIGSVGKGDTLLVLGKTLAFTVVEMHNKNDGKLVAQGRHTKFVAIAHTDPENEFKIENAKMIKIELFSLVPRERIEDFLSPAGILGMLGTLSQIYTSKISKEDYVT
ncbi:6988_t:CDS:2 [Dentiscutata erythropus]|uniref:6988_t:CDS:1 n=1 Tax=Dentiscutata erythropus TaxID=1348616 RepID=A0A9N8ZW65_9GLOM|nr:6988_t:CDS:2 [Dentiscutata erythropus]